MIEIRDNIVDYISLSITLFSSVFTIIFAITIHFKKDYNPVRAKSIKLSILLMIAGLIHVWSSFLSNDHFKISANLPNIYCPLITYWFQYVFGLNSWICLIILRVISNGSLFSDKSFKDISWKKLKYSIIIFISSIIFILTIIITITKQSFIDETEKTCKSTIISKILISCWILFSCLILILITIPSQKRIKNNYYSDYKAVRDIIIFGIICLSINATITFLNLLSNNYGRLIYDALLNIMHVFTFMRLLGYSIFKSIEQDPKYVQIFQLNLIDNQPSRISTSDLLKNDKILEDFIFYCHHIACANGIELRKVMTADIIIKHEIYLSKNELSLNENDIKNGMKILNEIQDNDIYTPTVFDLNPERSQSKLRITLNKIKIKLLNFLVEKYGQNYRNYIITHKKDILSEFRVPIFERIIDQDRLSENTGDFLAISANFNNNDPIFHEPFIIEEEEEEKIINNQPTVILDE